MKINFPQVGIWLLRIIAATIMLQTLFFKFSGAEESIYIFTKLGIEPWGRIGTGIIELLASILILNPRTTGIGAAIGLGVMAGALLSHLAKLGIDVKHDGGQLFAYALIVFFSCAFLLIFHLNQVKMLLKKFF